MKKILLMLAVAALSATGVRAQSAARGREAIKQRTDAGAYESLSEVIGLTRNAAAVNSLFDATLGAYPNATVAAGGNTIVTPTAAPTGASSITARTSANFKGVLSVNPTIGAVRVTDAQPAGVYTVTVTALDAAQTMTTATFQLTVSQPLTCASPFTTANFTAAPGSPYRAQVGPQFPEVGDFNNDGIADVVVANFDTNSVSLLTGTGGGGFNAAVNIATNGTFPQFIAVADYNGDGNQDFAGGNSTTNNISVLLGNGTGAFTLGTPVNVGFANIGITAADFNGDGKSDLLVSQLGNPAAVSLQIGTGDGKFASGGTIGGRAFPRGFAVADFNGDTRLDFVVAEGGGNRVSSYLGQCAVAPTAASVLIGGRVLTTTGRGLANATVILTDQNGNRRTARTTAFGYFRFTDVPAGETYVFAVISKRYLFTAQVMNVSEDITELNFIGASSDNR